MTIIGALGKTKENIKGRPIIILIVIGIILLITIGGYRIGF